MEEWALVGIISALIGAGSGFFAGFVADFLRDGSVSRRVKDLEGRTYNLIDRVNSVQGNFIKGEKKQAEKDLTEQEVQVLAAVALKGKELFAKAKAEGKPIDKNALMELGLNAVAAQPSLFRHLPKLQEALGG